MPAKAQPAAVVAATWTGFYVGVHGGWGWVKTRVDDSQASPTFRNTEIPSSGPLAGAQLGVNWQFGRTVVGLEVDGSWASLRNSTSSNFSGIIGNTIPAVKFQALATATARLGYASGPWLFYAKAGGAWADMQLITRFSPTDTIYNQSRFGVAAGGGLEVAFLRNVSAKVEYNFLYFSPDHLFWNSANYTNELDYYLHLVKFGLNVRLTP